VGRQDKRTAKTLMRELYVVVSHVLADEFSQVRRGEGTLFERDLDPTTELLLLGLARS
jgi:hypothetical protein